jgi:hypothetical protein
MSNSKHERWILAGLTLFAAIVFCIGINWGLPSRRVDPFLFGDHPVWSGAEIDRLAPRENENVGADVDANPIGDRNHPILLNDTDAKRAEIVRRYRLFSDQPDEMITFKSLSRIRESHGDPRLYQYGGLWMYPVGVMLKAASVVGLLDLRSDRIYYLDHPDAFGRFYVFARLYVVLWGLVGVWAVFWIAKRLSNDVITASAAALCYTLLPVVVNMAHEAKPHLPGAVLVLLAIIAAAKFVETTKWKWALRAGALCGAAFAMVLSALLGFVVLPMMVLLAEMKWSKRLGVLCASTAIGFALFAMTNPFVVKHLLSDPQMLRSNLGNSSAMYQAPFSGQGLVNAMKLIGEGATPVLAILGVFGIVVMIRRQSSLAWLLIAAMLMVLVQFVLLASNKPGEYARFAMLPDIVLVIAAVTAAGVAVRRVDLRCGLLALLCVIAGVWGASYEWHFINDSVARSSRVIAAERLRRLQQDGAHTLLVAAEPAPYSLPPVDLFSWQIILAPKGGMTTPTDVMVMSSDYAGEPVAGAKGSIDYWIRPRLLPTPISWAAKPWYVKVDKDIYKSLDTERK